MIRDGSWSSSRRHSKPIQPPKQRSRRLLAAKTAPADHRQRPQNMTRVCTHTTPDATTILSPFRVPLSNPTGTGPSTCSLGIAHEPALEAERAASSQQESLTSSSRVFWQEGATAKLRRCPQKPCTPTFPIIVLSVPPRLVRPPQHRQGQRVTRQQLRWRRIGCRRSGTFASTARSGFRIIKR